MKDRTKPRGSAKLRELYHAQKGQPFQRTVSVLSCSWCKKTAVTWTNTPKGKMHLDCPERPVDDGAVGG
jgi:hypothetical protein